MVASNCHLLLREPLGSAPPDGFPAGCTGREFVWDGLHSDVQGYILQQKRRLMQLEQHIRDLDARTKRRAERNGELSVVFDSAWRNRFKNALEYKAVVLQQAHTCQLRALRDLWNDRKVSQEGAGHSFSIHSLGTDLLERILDRVAPDPPWEGVRSRTNPHKRECESGWRQRRVLAQVCRLFEALAYAAPRAARFPLDQLAPDTHRPPCFSVRDLERLPLSANLHELVLYFPADRPSGEASDVGAAAAALPHCPTLRKLSLSTARSSSAAAGEIVSRLSCRFPTCRQLSHLELGDANVLGRAALLELPVQALRDLAAALEQMPALARLDLVNIHVHGPPDAHDVLLGALSRCQALREMRCKFVWQLHGLAGLLGLSQLQSLATTCCELSTTATQGPVCPAFSTSFTKLSLGPDRLPAGWEAELARALPSMAHLHSLAIAGGNMHTTAGALKAVADALPHAPVLRELGFHMANAAFPERVCEALPFCKHLSSLELKGGIAYEPRWAALLAGALPQCPNLAALTLQDFDATSFVSLGPLWRALPRCARLAECEVIVQLDAVDAAVLAPVLERCPALKKLTIGRSGLAQPSIDMLHWAAQRAGIEFCSSFDFDALFME